MKKFFKEELALLVLILITVIDIAILFAGGALPAIIFGLAAGFTIDAIMRY